MLEKMISLTLEVKKSIRNERITTENNATVILSNETKLHNIKVFIENAKGILKKAKKAIKNKEDYNITLSCVNFENNATVNCKTWYKGRFDYITIKGGFDDNDNDNNIILYLDARNDDNNTIKKIVLTENILESLQDI